MEKARGGGLVALRLRMLECAQKEGISEASRRFGVSRPTLYKLLARYQEKGPEGLLNRPHGGSCRNTGDGVRAEYIGDNVWMHLVDSKVVITHAGKTIAEHSLTVHTLAVARPRSVCCYGTSSILAGTAGPSGNCLAGPPTGKRCRRGRGSCNSPSAARPTASVLPPAVWAGILMLPGTRAEGGSS